MESGTRYSSLQSRYSSLQFAADSLQFAADSLQSRYSEATVSYSRYSLATVKLPPCCNPQEGSFVALCKLQKTCP